MAYRELSDVTTVVLGGKNKETGAKNPTELEGYYLRREERPNKFNPGKPQSYYVFQTVEGQVGVYGKAGIDREMKKATVGHMTKLVDTGQLLNTGKGNPMRVFKVYQDASNTIEVESYTPETVVAESAATEDYEEPSYESDEPAYDEVAPVRAAAPRIAAAIPSATQQARVQALLSKNRVR